MCLWHTRPPRVFCGCPRHWLRMNTCVHVQVYNVHMSVCALDTDNVHMCVSIQPAWLVCMCSRPMSQQPTHWEGLTVSNACVYPACQALSCDSLSCCGANLPPSYPSYDHPTVWSFTCRSVFPALEARDENYVTCCSVLYVWPLQCLSGIYLV